jgi:hypothetical protein
MKYIELTDEEIRVLISMIDVAVRARGMEAAESGVHFVKKLQEAAPAYQATEKPEEAEG